MTTTMSFVHAASSSIPLSSFLSSAASARRSSSDKDVMCRNSGGSYMRDLTADLAGYAR